MANNITAQDVIHKLGESFIGREVPEHIRLENGGGDGQGDPEIAEGS
jgi:hypothetical protein